MNKEEIIEFNKRCAEFLKDMKYIRAYPESSNLMYKIDTSLFKTPFSKELTSKINHFESGEVILRYMILLEDLKFHSDWNWIMEVYLKINRFIQIKSIENFILGTETNDVHLAMWEAFEDTDNNKEKLVHAINQFLIWYGQKYK
jgi:hypothetical protein